MNAAIFLTEIRDSLIRAMERDGCAAPPECSACIEAINHLMMVGDSRVNVEAVVKALLRPNRTTSPQ